MLDIRARMVFSAFSWGRAAALCALMAFPLTSAAASTYVKNSSQPGDYIGVGAITTTTTVSASGNATHNYANFSAGGFQYSFQPATGTLIAGTYENATRYPFNLDGTAGLSVYGNGRGCNTLTGRFIVHELEFGGGTTINRAAIDLEQHCEGSRPALFSFIRFNSDVEMVDQDSDGVLDIQDNCPAVANAEQADTDGDGIGNACDAINGLTFVYMESEQGDYIGQGQTISLAPSSSNFVMSNAINVGYAKLTVDGFTFEFSAPQMETLAVGEYEGVTRYYSGGAAVPGLNVASSNRGCYSVDGYFKIQEIVRDENSQVKHFAAEFEQHCNGGPALHGVIRYNAEQVSAGAFDTDGDGVIDISDNCSAIANSTQTDADKDKVGDACDAFPNDGSESADADIDGIGDNSDLDDDNDGVLDVSDELPFNPSETIDSDKDGTGNNADTDDDNDGILDTSDNCPLISNPSQADTDHDGIGNECDAPYVLDSNVSGTRSYSRAGWSVASAGDFDGDGNEDIVLGMPLRDNLLSLDQKIKKAGHAEVISGKTGEVLAQIDGIYRNAMLGFSVAGGGDVDDDGYDDVVIGAPSRFSSALPSVTVLYGPNGQRTRKISGDKANEDFGFSLAMADVNNDSHADILIGVPKRKDEARNLAAAGSVVLVNGASQVVMATFYGDTAGAHAGTSVAAASVDGTSSLNVIVGAPDDDDIDNRLKDAGSVSVFRYASSNRPFVKIFGVSAKSHLGAAVASGDLNGDGRYEIIAGAPNEKDSAHNAKNAGSVAAYSMYSSTPLMKQYGAANAQLGTSVAAGDMDADGLDDVVAGAPRDAVVIAGRKLFSVGSVAVWRGSDYSLLGSAIHGTQSGERFGSALAVGDFDQDAAADLIIGSPGFDAEPTDQSSKPLRDAGTVSVVTGAEL